MIECVINIVIFSIVALICVGVADVCSRPGTKEAYPKTTTCSVKPPPPSVKK